uniref:ABC2_membrane_7 domain-containing protein n=1 Tax=Caenorhabditis japonica TaxID=281687 RepID=A0A8R1IUT0_CAEJA
MAENVIQILRGIAKTGRTIICTIHQPSSQLYQMFHRVIYLANGQTAFQGTPPESISFFERCGHRVPDEYNPSEWIIYKLAIQPGMESQSLTRIEHIIEEYERSEHRKKVVQCLEDPGSEKSRPEPMHKANVFTQFWALLSRYVFVIYATIHVYVSVILIQCKPAV